MLFSLSQQRLLALYWVVGVGLLGNGIFAWKLGRLGWFGIAMKGLRSRGAKTAYLLWIAAVVWSAVDASGHRSAQPHASRQTVMLCVLSWICIYTIARISMPLPLRLFNVAKTLHEMAQETYGVSPDAPAEQQEAFGADPHVLRAEALYGRAANLVRHGIRPVKPGSPWNATWTRNLAAVHIQLSVLNTQKNEPREALDNALAAQAALSGLSPAVLGEPASATLVNAAATRIAVASRLLGQDPPDSPVPPMPAEFPVSSIWSAPGPTTVSQRHSILPGISYTLAFLTTLGIGTALGVALDSQTARAWATLGPFRTRMSIALAVSVVVASLIATASARRQLTKATLRGEQVSALRSLGNHALRFLAAQLGTFSACAYSLMPGKRIELFVNSVGHITHLGILAGVLAAEIAAGALTGKLLSDPGREISP